MAAGAAGFAAPGVAPVHALSGSPGRPGPSLDPPSRIVLGIDPGTQVVGWAVLAVEARAVRLVGAGVVRASSRAVVWRRLGEIRCALDLLLAKHRPHTVVVEEAFARRNVQSALRIGEARGVVLSAAAAFGADVWELPPAVAKKAIVGNGGATKEQVAAMVCRLLGLRSAPEPLDATDALALALAHVLRAHRAAAVDGSGRRASSAAALRAAKKVRLT